jgi:hypothetical protein
MTTPISVESTSPNALVSVLEERGGRYGCFVDHAAVSQRLKRVVWEELATRDKQLASDQLEALEMIMHKIGRIINGDADYDDSWRDIAGYSMLVCDRLNGVIR